MVLNAPLVEVGVCEDIRLVVRPRVKIVHHVGGLPSADGQGDHDACYRVGRARRMVGIIARSWARARVIAVGALLLSVSPKDCVK